MLKCCFTSTETVGLLRTGAQDVHLDFHTASELWYTYSFILTSTFIRCRYCWCGTVTCAIVLFVLFCFFPSFSACLTLWFWSFSSPSLLWRLAKWRRMFTLTLYCVYPWFVCICSCMRATFDPQHDCGVGGGDFFPHISEYIYEYDHLTLYLMYILWPIMCLSRSENVWCYKISFAVC